MGHRVRLVAPSDNEMELSPIVGRIIGRWGGCTSYIGRGWWLDAKNQKVIDRLTILETSIGEWDYVAREWWSDLAEIVRKHWEQDCVFLSVVREEAKLLFASDKWEQVGG